MLEIPAEPIQWIADLDVPSWDCYFMQQVFTAAMRSNDAQTKQGAIFVDWPTKTVISTGYNGHPRKSKKILPVMREHSALFRLRTQSGDEFQKGAMVPPGATVVQVLTDGQWSDVPPDMRDLWIQKQPDKYKVMCHCETNALLQVTRPSEHAVLYLTMPSCDMCAGYVINHPFVKTRRVVYYEDRPYENLMLQSRPDVEYELYDVQRNGDPIELLIRAATYAKIRQTSGKSISKDSMLTYRGERKDNQ